MRSILVALDLSDHSNEVLAAAAGLARETGAHLTLVHVAAPDPDFVGFDAGPQPVRDSVAKELRAEHRELQERAERLRDDGVEARALLVQGPTGETIVAEAGRLEADVIVVGSHSKSPLARVLVGSVSHEVLKSSTRPVLVVPFPKD